MWEACMLNIVNKLKASGNTLFSAKYSASYSFVRNTTANVSQIPKSKSASSFIQNVVLKVTAEVAEKVLERLKPLAQRTDFKKELFTAAIAKPTHDSLDRSTEVSIQKKGHHVFNSIGTDLTS